MQTLIWKGLEPGYHRTLEGTSRQGVERERQGSAETISPSGHVAWVLLAILGVLLLLAVVGVGAWQITSGAGGRIGRVDPRTVSTGVCPRTYTSPGPAPGCLPLPPHGGAPIPYVP